MRQLHHAQRLERSRYRHTRPSRQSPPLGVALTTLVAAVLAFGASADVAAKTNKPKDKAIRAAIERELRYDKAIDADEIKVSVNHGVATLDGTVDHLLAERRAKRLTETVRGVTSIIDKLEPRPTKRSDWALKRDVDLALAADIATESYEVNVKAYKGRLILGGKVDSWAERELAEKVAAGVKGVKAITNKLEIRYKQNRTDREIKAELERRLRFDALVDHAFINVDVKSAKVKLTGIVGSLAALRRAKADAWTSGVREVDGNGLKIQPWLRPKLKRTRVPKIVDDKALSRAVADALLFDPRVSSLRVFADVDHGVVTLRGHVKSLQARAAAGQDARNTLGVRRVKNQLTVRSGKTSDRKLRKRIKAAFRRDPYLESFEIGVTVDRGKVRLKGTVDSYFEKSRAYLVSSTIAGVRAVQSKLKVQDHSSLGYQAYLHDLFPYAFGWYDYKPLPTFARDTEIESDIRDELFWSPLVDSGDIKIDVDKGVATLKGRVDTLVEMHAAVQNAYEGGATWVDNELRLRAPIKS